MWWKWGPRQAEEIANLRREVERLTELQQRASLDQQNAQRNFAVSTLLTVVTILIALMQPSVSAGRAIAVALIQVGILFAFGWWLLLRFIEPTSRRHQTAVLLMAIVLCSYVMGFVRWPWNALVRMLSARPESNGNATVPPDTPAAVAPSPDAALPTRVASVPPLPVAVTFIVQVVLLILAASSLLGSGRFLWDPADRTERTPTLIAVSVPTPSAAATEPLSTPTCTPTAEPPSFAFPGDGQPLDYEGSYMFQVNPVPGAELFAWQFEQNGRVVWDIPLNEPMTRSPAYSIAEDSPAHARFSPGEVLVSVRAYVCGSSTDRTTRRIVLMNRDALTPTPTPILTPITDCLISETCS